MNLIPSNGKARLPWASFALSLFFLLSYLNKPTRYEQFKAISCRLITRRSYAESASGSSTTPSLSTICESCSFAGIVYSCGVIFDANFYKSQNPDIDATLSDESAWQHWANEGFAKGYRSHSGNRIVKVILMTKDEFLLVRDFILYHVHLFGPENIYVIDGSSSSSKARKFLDGPARSIGVTVFWLPEATLEETGDAFNTVFRSLRWSSDFIIKLDTDEFLGLGLPLTSDIVTSISLVKEDIRSYIDTLPVGGESQHYKFQVAWNIMSQPKRTCTTSGGSAARPPLTDPPPLFSTPYRFWKVLMSAHAFDNIDLGAHGGTIREPFASLSISSPRYDSHLAVVHLHYPCFDEFFANTLRACLSHGYVNKGDSKDTMIRDLEKLTTRGSEINSWHKVRDLLSILRNETAAREEYLSRPPPGADISSTSLVPFSQLRDLLDRLGSVHKWGGESG